MEIKRIVLRNFKNIEKLTINELSNINVVAGSNNSGKSSFLQGIHFHIIAAIANRETRQQTFSSNFLMYSPSTDFTILRYKTPYTNFKENRSDSALGILAFDKDGKKRKQIIRLYKGRNHGNIGFEKSGDVLFGNMISDSNNLFSIYVPGLAGIPLREEYKSLSIVRKGIASGDSNLYLRNVILRINESNQLSKLNDLLHMIFPNATLVVNFDERLDEHIKVYVNDTIAGNYPLELSGTGLQQTLQIFSYIIFFNPSLLLLDEPDSHIHPDNQILLTSVLETISEEYNTKIILTTHSRILIESLRDSANYIWLKEGKKIKEEKSPNVLPILLDIGALNEYEKLLEDDYDIIFLTEDSNSEYLKLLIEKNNLSGKNILILSYKTTSKIWAAEIFSDFIRNLSLGTRIIVHRDRDFFTDNEVEKVIEKLENENTDVFITDYSDIEHYFLVPEHVAFVLNSNTEDIKAWFNDIAIKYHNKNHLNFTNKRNEINRSHLYKRIDDGPSTAKLIGDEIPLSFEKLKGKFFIKKVNHEMREKFGEYKSLICDSEYLQIEKLKDLINK